MAPTFTIDSYDISSYILWGDRSAEFGDPFTPQYGGNSAFNDGLQYVRTAGANREWVFPLLLTASSTDALHALVRDLRSHIFPRSQFKVQPQGASNATFYDVEGGDLEEHWDLYIDNYTGLKATLRLSTRPYGTTGTTRLVASVSATGPQQFSASSTLGDYLSLGNLEVRVGSVALDNNAVLAWGVHASPSYVAVWRAASLTSLWSGATVQGCSGAIASQVLSIPIPATGVVQD